ncbi:MAG: histidine kinase [Pseudomonadota bacterium]
MTSPSSSSHPLDIIPFFRRWPGSPMRDLLYTGIWNTMLALVIVIVSMLFSRKPDSFWINFYYSFVIANIIGYLIHFAMVGGDWLLRGWPTRLRGAPRVLYQVALVGLCVMLGVLLGTGLLKGVNPINYVMRSTSLLPFALLVGVFIVIIFLTGEKRIETETLAARQSEQLANAAQLLAEARLNALQAQIEPHFLYNTLANVVGLIETQPALARHMLERFIDFLRASLAASRAGNATLGAELDMIAAYLDVLGVRMGARLRYRFEVDEACRDIVIAPMLLQPVIENAVAHGLEPKVDGGEIVLRAQRQGKQLCIDISDTGAGLSGAPTKPGGGVGLSNLRARLRSMYDGAAQVQLLENQPSGITVRIVLPLRETQSSTIPVP